MIRRAALAVGFAFAVATVGPASAAPRPASPCVAILVGSSEETPRGGWGTKFSATRTTDLVFTALFLPGFTGEHLVELRVFTPKGFLYRSMTVPAVIEGPASGTRKVPRYPHPVRVKGGSKFSYQGSTLSKVDLTFPLGGTDIGKNSLYGTWRVQAHLDGAEEPCADATTFRITR